MKLKPLDLKLCRVMVVDGDAQFRAVLVSQLRELGAEQVSEHVRPQDALRILATDTVDLVLCQQAFDDTPSTGQDLFDELRLTRPLAFETLFVIVGAQVPTAGVPAAGVSRVDGLLPRPCTTDALSRCISLAHRRTVALRPAFEALRLGQIDLAARFCAHHLNEGGEFQLYAGQLAVELLLRQGETERAQALLTSLTAQGASSWAGLGLARCHLALGETQSALTQLHHLLARDPGHAQAHALQSQILQAQAQLPEALEAANRALRLTPGSVQRLQRVGILAFFNGQDEQARVALDRSILCHLGSPLFDAQVLLLRALLMYRVGDRPGLAACQYQLQLISRARLLDDPRLQRLAQQVQALVAAQDGDLARVTVLVDALGAPLQRDDCTAESAGHLMAVLSELARRQIEPGGADEMLLRIGLRFCVSPAAASELQALAAPHPPHVDLLRQSQRQLQDSLDAARRCVQEGDPARGVERMLLAAEHSLNARLLDNARQTLMRHRAKVPQHHHLQARIEQLALRLLMPVQGGPSAPSGALSRLASGAFTRPSSGAVRFSAIPG